MPEVSCCAKQTFCSFFPRSRPRREMYLLEKNANPARGLFLLPKKGAAAAVVRARDKRIGMRSPPLSLSPSLRRRVTLSFIQSLYWLERGYHPRVFAWSPGQESRKSRMTKRGRRTQCREENHDSPILSFLHPRLQHRLDFHGALRRYVELLEPEREEFECYGACSVWYTIVFFFLRLWEIGTCKN